MDPKQDRQVANRGAALWGDLVISPASGPARIVAADKSTGKVVWETNVSDAERITTRGRRFLSGTRSLSEPRAATPAPATGWGARRCDRQAVVAKIHDSAPGEPGSETWKDKNNAWRTGGGAVWVTGTYDPGTNQTLWGVGNPVPMMDARLRPGDNLFTNSVVSWTPTAAR